MAKDKQPVESSENGPPARRGRFGLILVLVLVASNVALGALLVLGGMGRGGAAAEAEDDDGTASAAGEAPGPLLQLEPFVLNLDEPGRPRYLRIALSFEIDSESSAAEVENRMTVLRDRFISYLSSQQADALRTPDDKERLRNELLTIARAVVSERSIESIYFTEFLIQ